MSSPLTMEERVDLNNTLLNKLNDLNCHYNVSILGYRSNLFQTFIILF